MTDTTKDERFLRSAIALANIWSKDPGAKVGAMAVGATPNLVAFGYNGFPPGINDHGDRLADRDIKLSLTLHAEVNALANAQFPVHTIYVSHCPCQNCALHILAARTIRRVVYTKQDDAFEARWEQSMNQSRAIFREAGVEVVEVVL